MSDTALKPTTTTTRVLVADDEPSLRFVLRETLEEIGCEVVDVADGEAARHELASGRYHLAFFDIRMPGPSGLDLLDHINESGIDTAVVIITAQNTFSNAVEAMKRGALDYLTKPFGVAEVKALASKALRTRALEEEVRELRRAVQQKTIPGDRLVGQSAALLDVFKTIGRVAPRNISVLITGESGTGKELVANAIHAASSRANQPIVSVNTAAIPRELLESELFGHERGAFTGAIDSRVGRFRDADGGTLFLDEIGDMPIDLQAKLLRVLQDGEVTSVGGKKPQQVDVRIIAATHRNLDTLVRDGSFREDLLYRLNVVPVHLPPLRERQSDIALLAQHFTQRYAEELAGGPRYLAPAAIDHLADHDWPGNVRELENGIKRALVLSNSEVLTADDFDFLNGLTTDRANGVGDLPALVMDEVEAALAAEETGDLYRTLLDRVERPLIETVLRRTEGNQMRAAALLGINRNTLRKKIVELGIQVPGR